MQIAEILRAIKSQLFTILEGRKCSNIVFYNMLRTYYIVSKQLDILHSCSLIKILQILLVLLTMSILTATWYKYISLGLLVICFSLIIYIITSEFLKLRSLYADLKIACNLQEAASSSPSSSWLMHKSWALDIIPPVRVIFWNTRAFSRTVCQTRVDN